MWVPAIFNSHVESEKMGNCPVKIICSNAILLLGEYAIARRMTIGMNWVANENICKNGGGKVIFGAS